MFLSARKAYKQRDNCKSDACLDIIHEFDILFKKLYLEFKSIKLSYKTFEENKIEYKDVLQPLINYLMDYYLLMRMFRTFDTKSKPRKFDSEEANNCIVYVGDAHARLYRKILSKIGFKTINSTCSNHNNKLPKEFEKCTGNRCLDISKFKVPFFKHSLN